MGMYSAKHLTHRQVGESQRKWGETVLEDGSAVFIIVFCSAALSAVALLLGVLCFIEWTLRIRIEYLKLEIPKSRLSAQNFKLLTNYWPDFWYLLIQFSWLDGIFFFNLRCDFIAYWDTFTLLGWQNYSILEDSYQILGIHVLRPHHAHWLLTPLTTCSFGGQWYLICNILPMMVIDATWSKHSPPMRMSLKPTLNNGAMSWFHSNHTTTVEWPQLRSVGILSMMCRRGNADKSSLG